MSAFHDNFQPDPESPEDRRLWRTAKPLLRDAVVTYAPPYPDYPRLKVSKSEGGSGDPGSPSARVPSGEIEVATYSQTNAFGDLQERAWRYILENLEGVEAALRRKLFAKHMKSRAEFVEEYLPEDKDIQKYWKEIEGKLKWDDVSAIDHLYRLVGIGLADSGLDECGFSSFEFQSGWDRDHGIGIVMHKDRVLAADGMTELISGGGSIVDAVKYVQTYDLDDGDLSLLDT
jgi:hypothetical protein